VTANYFQRAAAFKAGRDNTRIIARKQDNARCNPRRITY
jgi:hypothetical protein